MSKKTKQELLEQVEHSTYDLLNNLNKLIYKIETELQNYFFENVKDTYLSGDIEVPLVSKSYYSDFNRVKVEIKELESKIKFIDKKINNPNYFIADIMDSAYSKMLSESERKQYIDSEIFKEIEKLQKKKIQYQEKIRLIKENPKMYLRYMEFRDSDFSKITDEKIRNNLESKRIELKMYKEFRNNILCSIKHKNEDVKEYLYSKKINKHIDNE